MLGYIYPLSFVVGYNSCVPPLVDLTPLDLDFKCRKCGDVFDTCFPAMEHVEVRHGVDGVEAGLLDNLVLPHTLISVKCKFCNKEYLSDIRHLKAELREHREMHRELNTAVNDCFRLECRLCELQYEKLNQVKLNTFYSRMGAGFVFLHIEFDVVF